MSVANRLDAVLAGHREEALVTYQRALTLSDKYNDEHGRKVISLRLAAVLLQLRRHSDAKRLLEQILSRVTDDSSSSGVQVVLACADLYASAGMPSEVCYSTYLIK